jgi:hypothetical protein
MILPPERKFAFVVDLAVAARKSGNRCLAFYRWPEQLTVTMMSFTNEERLRDRIRQGLQDGSLPREPPARTWGGRGSGAPCAICGAPINPDQPEFEFEYGRVGNGNGPANLHVHVPCCSVWESERKALSWRRTGEAVAGLFAAEEGGNMRPREPQIT